MFSPTILSPEEAAALIQDGQTVGFSGFTPAGSPKAVPLALSERAKAEHEAGRPFQIGMITGASTGPSVDGALAKARAVKWRTPYQSDRDLRASINRGETKFFDQHLSLVPQQLRYGFFGDVDWAILEVAAIESDGSVILTTGVGISPTLARVAKKIILEVNTFHPESLRGRHDLFEPSDPPTRRAIPVFSVGDRIGSPVLELDTSKVVGMVRTHLPDEGGGFSPADDVTNQIGHNVAEFLAHELSKGRLPSGFLPIQSGVGNIANAVLGALGTHPKIPAFSMYTEVIQDAVLNLLREGKIRFASGVSLTVSPPALVKFYRDMESLGDKVLLRPQEITNHPEVVRRLGIISINTAIETDIFGNVNSTHVMGTNLMNGIGGSGDFTRNAYLSIFTCPSTAKDGKISTIVPLVSHMDHSEHSVGVVVTEQGVADLRGKDPHERARLVVDNCAHPDYRPILRRYFEAVKDGHTPQTLASAFSLHQSFLEDGDMRT